MILTALSDYYASLLKSETEDIPLLGYSREKISYAIVIDMRGNLVAVDDIRISSGKEPRPRSLVVPQSGTRTSGIRPNFLWDKTSYVLGVSAISKRCEKEHTAFKQLHAKALGNNDDEGLKALLLFLDAWNPTRFHEEPLFTEHGDQFIDSNVVFRLDSDQCYLHERPAAALVRERLLNEVETELGMCLVTGTESPVARVHLPIKGVDGAQSSGAHVVSFNLEASSSYGKEQGRNAPISERASFAYATALNHLLRKDQHNRQRIQIGDATVVFWAQAADEGRSRAAEDWLASLLNPDDEALREIGRIRDALELVRQGRPLCELDPDLDEDSQIFILGLSPNASRLSIRYWETDTLAAFTRRLVAHYEDLKLEPAPWKSPPSIWRLTLAAAPARDGKAKREDVPPLLAGELTRAILSGGAYPYSLLGTLLMRLRADRDEKMFGIRTALIKAVMVRARRLGQKTNHKGDLPVSLDTSNQDSGYLLGRLFAVLEQVQHGALGEKVNTTIRDRYYGSASATPATVFPVLLRNAQHHLGRLRKDKPRYAISLEKEVQEIMDLLSSTFPKSLKLESQGHFALGYYHQRSRRFATVTNSDDFDTDTETDSEGEE
jgi:CRISPR-associated protein Cas8c/Csd1, subtype I-C/DVULG